MAFLVSDYKRLKLEIAITAVALIMRREASLLLLGVTIYKAVKFISHSLNGNQTDVVDDSSTDGAIPTQTISPPATKYDVFLSFRGEDTRRNFASHLYKELCKAGIHTFMDYKIDKGDEISQVLTKTIEESEISMIIFSENYASSKWCMDELVHILECKKKFRRFVIPIFYNIDPSSIRKQNANFGKAFEELKQRFRDNPEKLQKWRAALIKSASLCGWDSNSTRPECKLVEGIVNDTLIKLNYNSSYHFEGLVGIARHIKNIESLLIEARIVGIWGMGGAGKTTLANAIFQKLRSQFSALSFIENVREKLQKISLDELQKIFLEDVLQGEKINIYDIKSPRVKKRLGRKKILLVLDDVDNSRTAANLTKVLECFGEGSRILITSRDRQVLKNASSLSTYHVPVLDFHDAIHLFSLKAFKQNEPSEGYMELSESVVKYCDGNPLALVVLGCFLYGREKEEWDSAVEKLNQDPPHDIVDVLKFSFNGLDEKQQNVFLDLVFLINERVSISLNLIRQLYGSSGLIEISVLMEKSLISYDNYKRIVMHDLVKKMGLKIASEQLFSDARIPIRLWRHQDIAYFFNQGKGFDTVRCLSLDVSKMKSIELTVNIFQMMHNLIYLNIYKSNRRKPLAWNIRGVLNYISEELRFLVWEECPLPYVPLHFCAENLIELKMPKSNIQQLWNGNQLFPNLEEIDLSYSKDLIALPDLSHSPNLGWLCLDGCVKLAQIHSSTFLRKNFGLTMYDCGPVQIKVGGSMKGRSSGSMIVFYTLNLQDLSFHKVTMKVLVCGNMICGVRFKHVEMSLEENEELRKEAQSLWSALPFVKWAAVRWLDGPFEFGHDFNQYFHCDRKERGDRGGVMNEYKVVTNTMTLLTEDEEGDDEVLIEDCCNESVTFTRVPKSITRWSLLTQLALKSLALISHDEYCSFPQVSILKSIPLSHRDYCRRTKPLLDVTLSFPDHIPLSRSLSGFSIYYNSDDVFYPSHYVGMFFECSRDSIYEDLSVSCVDLCGVAVGTIDVRMPVYRRLSYS